MIKTILFDVDGTISDTEYVMTNSLQKHCVKKLEEEYPIKNYIIFLGIPGGGEAIKKFVNTERRRNSLYQNGVKRTFIIRQCSKFSAYRRNITDIACKRDSIRTCYI